MRKHSAYAALALALCLASAGAAAAKTKSKTLTFGTDFYVGATLVKAGTYKIIYDDKTGEVTIADKSGKTTVASATVKVEQREKSKAGWDVVLAPKADGLSLISLSFPGDRQNLVVGDSATAGNTTSGGAGPAVAP